MAEDTKEQSLIKDEPNVDVSAWESAQYEAALAHLERLQGKGYLRAERESQIDDLRSTIPSLIAPLLRPPPTKAQMFVEVKKVAIRATDDVKAFRESWTNEESQNLLKRATMSLEKDGNLEAASRIHRYGWSEMDEDDRT